MSLISFTIYWGSMGPSFTKIILAGKRWQNQKISITLTIELKRTERENRTWVYRSTEMLWKWNISLVWQYHTTKMSDYWDVWGVRCRSNETSHLSYNVRLLRYQKTEMSDKWYEPKSYCPLLVHWISEKLFWMMLNYSPRVWE